MRRAACFLLLALPLLGCPPSDKEKQKATPAAAEGCTKFGQTCEVSPGKLGTCVARDGCTAEGAACLVCQSQH